MFSNCYFSASKRAFNNESCVLTHRLEVLLKPQMNAWNGGARGPQRELAHRCHDYGKLILAKQQDVDSL